MQIAQESVKESKELTESPEMAPLSQEHWLVNPIYFLYRHAIELALKDILSFIKRERKLTPKQEKLIDCSHDPLKLWEAAKPWVMSFAQRALGQHVAACESMLREIQHLDPNAEAGHHHLAKVGKSSHLVASFEGLAPLDFNTLHQNATKILNFIQWIWTEYEEKVQDDELRADYL